MTSLTIYLPLPQPELFPNSKKHWRIKARAVRTHRWAAMVAARQALGNNSPPRWERGSYSAVFSVRHDRHDPDGLMSSLKSYIDGLQDAGVITNDRHFFPERPVREVVKTLPYQGPHRLGLVAITIRPEPTTTTPTA